MTALLWGIGGMLLLFTLLVLIPVIRVVKPKTKVVAKDTTAVPVSVVTTTEKTVTKKKIYLLWIVLAIAVIMVVIYTDLYQWRPSFEKKVDMDFPEIELKQNGMRNGIVVPMNFSTQVKVKILIPLTREGISYGLCGKVVEPIKVLDLADTPRKHTEADDPEKRGVSHFMHLTSAMKKHLLNHGYKEARVNFYLIEKNAGDPVVCN